MRSRRANLAARHFGVRRASARIYVAVASRQEILISFLLIIPAHLIIHINNFQGSWSFRGRSSEAIGNSGLHESGILYSMGSARGHSPKRRSRESLLNQLVRIVGAGGRRLHRWNCSQRGLTGGNHLPAGKQVALARQPT